MATGDRGQSARPRSGEQGGFTLVEILVVLTIIILLFAMVAVSSSTYLQRAYESATKALILRLQDNLDAYKRVTGHYPPDGVDYAQEDQQGTAIQGSACLHYFLTQPIVIDVVIGGVKQPKEYPAIVPGGFRDADLSDEDPENPGVRMLVDGFGNPLHYDNTEDGVLRPQRGEINVPPIPDENYPLDPRDPEAKVNGEPAVPRPGQVQSTFYDLWSNADQGYEGEEVISPPIASWNIK